VEIVSVGGKKSKEAENIFFLENNILKLN